MSLSDISPADGSLTNPPLGADAQATVTFMTGVAGNGKLVLQESGWSWDPVIANRVVFDGTSWAHKWGGGPAGSPAAVSYSFDPASQFTADEQAIISGALALWSAESGVSFQQVAGAQSAQLSFYRHGSPNDPGSAGGVYTSYDAPTGSFGAASLPATDSVFVSLDTSVSYWSKLSDFTAFGGYGVDSIVHELGHAIGLFHSGPYNGTVDPLTQQLNSTDSRQWSIMSYIDPWARSADSSQYTYKNTNWGASQDGFAREPTTPMPLDILAAQRLYGLPTTTPLDGGEVFGFHCNIVGPVGQFFDFTRNTTPVVTLWDEGTGNALDLSGFDGASSVDLRPGTFSSAAGMTNNIGIAYGTRIDRVVGSRGGGSVTLNGDGDTVQATGGVNVAVVAVADGLFAVGDAGGGTATVRASDGAVDELHGVQALQFAGGGNVVVGADAGIGLGTIDLAGGDNLLFQGGGAASVRSAGGDTVVTGAGGTSIAVTGTAGSLIFGGDGAFKVRGGAGLDTVVSGSSGGLVYGDKGGAVVWAAGPLVYIGGAGAATVAADANASVTVGGGIGGGVFVGGGAGGNVLGATGGATTLVGGGNGDQLVARNAADNVLAAGAGAETLYAVGATGANLFFAGAGTVAMAGGDGSNLFVAGAGNATINPGVGNSILECIAGHAGGDVVAIGWDPARDRLMLSGYGPDAEATALAHADVDAAGGTVVTLPDATRILFADLTGIGRGWFA